MRVDLKCGDCLEIMKNIPDKSIDLIITSPPYDDLRTYNGTLNWNFGIFKKIAKELFRITKDGGIIVWIVGDKTIKGSETGTSFKQALYFKEIGFNLHDTMIWQKQTFTDTGSLKTRYGNVFEYMFILSKGKPKTFNPIIDKIVTTNNGSKKTYWICKCKICGSIKSKSTQTIENCKSCGCKQRERNGKVKNSGRKTKQGTNFYINCLISIYKSNAKKEISNLI